MPDGVTIPGGPSFAGTPLPPDVPCDPTGEAWRGPPGPTGPMGPTGAPGAAGAVASGPTASRPALPPAGTLIVYGDTTLGQPVFGFSTGWKNAAGVTV